MATKKKPALQPMQAVFSAKPVASALRTELEQALSEAQQDQEAAEERTAEVLADADRLLAKHEPDYDRLVPLRLKEASDAKLRCLITWADYCYWVKAAPVMGDQTFDMLVREYESRQPDDRDFLDKIGMWS